MGAADRPRNNAGGRFRKRVLYRAEAPENDNGKSMAAEDEAARNIERA